MYIYFILKFFKGQNKRLLSYNHFLNYRTDKEKERKIYFVTGKRYTYCLIKNRLELRDLLFNKLKACCLNTLPV